MTVYLMSIRPRWARLIASGRKTIEVRRGRTRFRDGDSLIVYETVGDGGRGALIARVAITCASTAAMGELSAVDLARACLDAETAAIYTGGRTATLLRLSVMATYDPVIDMAPWRAAGWRPPQRWARADDALPVAVRRHLGELGRAARLAAAS